MDSFSAKFERYAIDCTFSLLVGSALVLVYWLFAGAVGRFIGALALAAYGYVIYLYWQSPPSAETTQYPHELFWTCVGYFSPLMSLPLSFVVNSSLWWLGMVCLTLFALFCLGLVTLAFDPWDRTSKQASRCPRPNRDPPP
jgi:hypothetical protein